MLPLVDVEVRLVAGDTHVRDSTPQAFATAGSLALQALQVARQDAHA